MTAVRPVERAGLFRAGGGRRVTFIELFFDLVYVFAVTQLSHLLLEDLTWRGAAQTMLLLLAVWWAWVYTAWFTNWYNPDNPRVRLLLVAIMLASLIMSAALPEAFGDRGLMFGAAWAAMQVGRPLFVVATCGSQPGLRRNFQRILAWNLLDSSFWVAGGLAHGSAREALWVAAVAIGYSAPAAGFYTPGLGRSTTADWNVSGGHMAERCQLFLIVALGESILVTGNTFGDLHGTPATVAAFVVAFAGSVALWWLYFDRAAEDSGRVIGTSDDPGRLARSAYTYCHLPMVAGVIVAAVADELTIAHPEGHVQPAVALAVLGGPALFLAGHALFKRAVFGVVSVSRLVAIGVLAALGAVAPLTSPLALATAATLVVAAVAVRDQRIAARR